MVLRRRNRFVNNQRIGLRPNAKAKILTEHGIGIAVKIDVKDPAKTKNLVKLDSKQSKVDFKDVTETSGTYTFKAPYTVNTSATVEKIERDETVKNNKPVSPEWITFAEVEGSCLQLLSEQGCRVLLW